MTTNIPVWLKPELFEDLLKKNVKEFSNIKNFKVSPALPSGENYATIMLRIEIEYSTNDSDNIKTKSFVIKLPFENELLNEMNKERNIFECEFKIYNEIISELETMYENAGLKVQFGAQHFELPITEDYILLEDLKQRNFQNAKRINGLNKQHMEAVLKKLAQWHAATATRIALKGAYEPNSLIMQSFFTESQRPFIEKAFKGITTTFIQAMEWTPGKEDMFKALQATLENLTDLLFVAAKPNPLEFNVLNHGDLWLNNIMFQYDVDSGDINETYLVDFQTTKYGSPAQDLLYLLISSTQLDLKVKHFDDFILYYYEQLIKYLKLLNYPKKLPTLKEIHIAILRNSIWALVTIIGTMASVNLEKTEGADLNNFLSETDEGVKFKNQLFSSARFRSHLNIVLPWLYYRGALDY